MRSFEGQVDDIHKPNTSGNGNNELSSMNTPSHIKKHLNQKSLASLKTGEKQSLSSLFMKKSKDAQQSSFRGSVVIDEDNKKRSVDDTRLKS